MSDMANAQADLLAHSGELDSTNVDKAFDMLKYYFAVANVVGAWREGDGHWIWCVEHQSLAFKSATLPDLLEDD